MGRVTGKSGTGFGGYCLPGFFLALLALALFVAAPSRAAHAEGNHPAGAASGGKQKGEDTLAEREEKAALEHVTDAYHVELFGSFGPHAIELPHTTVTIAGREVTVGLSKFMLLEFIAAVLVAAVYIPVARRLRAEELPRGGWANAFELLLTFIRDEVARPALGEHEADHYLPFLWTAFLFILFNNLLGLVPFCGSATGNIFVTLGLAICAFFAIHGAAVAKMGLVHYLGSMWPDIDVPFPLGYVIKPVVYAIELVGVLVRNMVLAVRLFANMFAGHVVLATILIFIYAAGTLHPALWGSITVASVLGQVALSLLELFVAFLQAYIFTFLTALFMGMALHPAH